MMMLEVNLEKKEGIYFYWDYSVIFETRAKISKNVFTN